MQFLKKLFRKSPDSKQDSTIYYNHQMYSPVTSLSLGKKNSKYKIAHLGIHCEGNAGDTLLFPVLRELLLKNIDDIRFDLYSAHQIVDNDLVQNLNKYDLIVIGGGGLFLKDTNKNNVSGWQWPCSIEMMHKIKTPIALFAVGNNRFRGQDDFEPYFYENIRHLLEISPFFSLRNHGSIQTIGEKIAENDLKSKILWQPCPTTVLSKIYPNKLKKTFSKNLVVNLAFDRDTLRFDNEEIFFTKLIRALKFAEEKGWKIIFYYHHIADYKAKPYVESNNFASVDLLKAPAEVVTSEYLKADLVLGMRGHAQMIPFGLGVPIYSLVSHNKLQYFIDDIGHSDWGCEVNDVNLDNKIISFITNYNSNNLSQQISIAKNELWNVTINNVKKIEKIITNNN